MAVLVLKEFQQFQYLASPCAVTYSKEIFLIVVNEIEKFQLKL
jgi:hypothetical protein